MTVIRDTSAMLRQKKKTHWHIAATTHDERGAMGDKRRTEKLRSDERRATNHESRTSNEKRRTTTTNNERGTTNVKNHL